MTEAITQMLTNSAERGWLPEKVIRKGIRMLCAERLAEEERHPSIAEFAARLRQEPVAPIPEKANQQHYEVPAEFFLRVLGPHLKYSCCYWDGSTRSLEQAETNALEVTCDRAEIADGQNILELGCGWGSLSLWIAERYPRSQIVAVSNSRSQQEFISARAAARGLENLQVITRDMNEFSTTRQFDRVVSVEMFEHMRNYGELMRRVASWLNPGGKLFVHVFCHRRFAYEFEEEGASNWMGRHFFSGGIMPSRDLLARFQNDLTLVRQWIWDGIHYRKTAEAWIRNLDAAEQELRQLFEKLYGPDQATRWFYRWRIFFLACAELWGFRGGHEWQVAHYLFENRQAQTPVI